MHLQKDGTAVVTVAGQELTLRTPTWGELKGLRKGAVKIQEQASLLLKAWESNLLDGLSDESKSLMQAVTGKKTDKRAWQRRLESLPQEEQDKINASLFDIQVMIPETTGGLAADWWVSTIATLNGAEVSVDEIPGPMANINTIEQFIIHVETTPFDSGL
jgi:hypothetical protein